MEGKSAKEGHMVRVKREQRNKFGRIIYSAQDSKSVILWLCAHPSAPRPPLKLHTNIHTYIHKYVIHKGLVWIREPADHLKLLPVKKKKRKNVTDY